MKILTFDIEADNLLRDVAEIHAIVTEDHETGEIKRYHDYFMLPSEGTLDNGIRELESADILVGHNICGYDLNVLERIGGAVFPENQMHIDTMLLSCILHPNMRENGLEAWFKVLDLEDLVGVSKIKITDFSVLTARLLDRCVMDVKGNTILYKHLFKEVGELQGKHSDVLSIGKALELEQKVSEIHSRQVLHGIAYDVHLAEQLVEQWDNIMSEIERRIHDIAPRKCVMRGSVPVKRPFIKCGKDCEVHVVGEYQYPVPNSEDQVHYAKVVTDWIDPDYWNVQGPFTKVEFRPLNLNSGKQVKDFLLTLGWQPTEWNYTQDPMGRPVKSSPKLTEDSYDSLPEGLGKDVAHYNIVKHRRSLLVNQGDDTLGSLPLARKRYDPETKLGNVAADAFTCGTNTARYTHVKPVANLPSVDARYGYESRAIYVPPYGAYQVGIDLSGIEARELCHLCYPYPGGPEFAEMVLLGDWHSENASMWNVERRIAKIILYAMMYGAGDAKLGHDAGGDARRGAKIRSAFMEANPAYATLVEDLTEAYQTNGGWIPSIDGRPLYPRSKKDCLNTKIQGDSAIIFKHWMVNCQDLEDVKRGYAHQMVAYHDETQWAYYQFELNAHPERFGQAVCEMATLTGEQLGINVPIEAKYQVGVSYAQCH